MSSLGEVEEKIVRAFGDDEEIERLDAGFLRAEDADRVVREVVFGPIYDWPNASSGLKPAAVVELQNVRYPKNPLPLNSRVEFSTSPSEELGREPFLRLKQLQEIFAGQAEEVVPLTVEARVGKLKHRRYKARVVVVLGNGPGARRLTRDVWLDGEDDDYAVGERLDWSDIL